MSERIMPLSLLQEGEEGRILSLDRNRELTRRLTDLGFIEGTRVRCLYSSPSGDPAAYQVRGTVIALRREDSAGIMMAMGEYIDNGI